MAAKRCFCSQRVLKYPLFLKEMHKLVHEGSSERELLWGMSRDCGGCGMHKKCYLFVGVVTDAVSSVETVANYINEVQRVYDSYHTLFEMILKDANFKEV